MTIEQNSKTQRCTFSCAQILLTYYWQLNLRWIEKFTHLIVRLYSEWVKVNSGNEFQTFTTRSIKIVAKTQSTAVFKNVINNITHVHVMVFRSWKPASLQDRLVSNS